MFYLSDVVNIYIYSLSFFFIKIQNVISYAQTFFGV
jgi:hypothetical protein